MAGKNSLPDNLKKSPNLNYLWAMLIIEECRRNGAALFCVAPGSRCAPLIAAAARMKVPMHVHPDERGLGFYALGHASATGKPVVVITTSGTAAANLLPSVVEASKKKLPLIILTADRPPELQKTGGMQTIEQSGMFGTYARWTFDLPCPDVSMPLSFVLTTVDQAFSRGRGEIPGPVQINCMFRDPLYHAKQRWPAAYLLPLKSWMKTNAPRTEYLLAERQISDVAMEGVQALISQWKEGLIVAGKLKGSDDAKAVLLLAERTGFPVFADVTSGLRLGCVHPHVIAHFDQILLSKKIRLPLDGIIHLGGRITSKRYYEFVNAMNPADYISVLGHPLRSDPEHRVTLRVQSGVADFVDGLMRGMPAGQASGGLAFLRTCDRAVERILDRELAKGFTEMAIARVVSQEIGERQGLFLSNSMPVRDMDMYADHRGAPVVIGANRGASGIDGIVASAAGFAAGLGRAVTALVGDIAFLHDMNSLAMLKGQKTQVIFIVINNRGGGIFSFLPISSDRSVFEKYVAADHDWEFSHAARTFGLRYEEAADLKSFRRVYCQALKDGQHRIIECKTERALNHRQHLALQKKIVKILPNHSIGL